MDRELRHVYACNEKPSCALCSLLLPVRGTDRVFCPRAGKVLEHVRDLGEIEGVRWVE